MTTRIAGFSLVLWLAASVALAGERQTLIQQVRSFAGQAVQSIGQEIDKTVAAMRKGADSVAHDVPKGLSDLVEGGRKGIASGVDAAGVAWGAAVQQAHSAASTVTGEIAPVGTAPISKTPVAATRGIDSPILSPAFLRGRDILLAWNISTSGRPFRRSFVLDDRVLFEDQGNDLYSFDPRSGIVQWVYPLPGASQGIYRADPNIVYVVAQDTLYELDRTIGLPRRRIVFQFPVASAPTLQDDRVVIAGLDRRVYAIARETRVKEWTFVPPDIVESAPAAGPNMVYAGDVGGKLTAYSPPERRIQWTYKAADAIRVPLLMFDDDLFFPSEDLNVHSVNRFGGHLAWRFPVKGPVKQQPWIDGDRVYFSAENDALYAIDREKGDLIWRCPNGGWPVAVGRHNLYIQGPDQEVWCLDRDTGTRNWSVSAKPFTHFVRNSDTDHIYLCSDKGEIYALYLRGDHIEKKVAPAEKVPPKKGVGPEPEAAEGAPKATTPKLAPKLPTPRPKVAPKVVKKAEEGEEPKEAVKEKAEGEKEKAELEKPAVEPKAPDEKKSTFKSKAPEGARTPAEEEEEAEKKPGKKEEKAKEEEEVK
jgi:outer membrane protein assembly factor BamB